MKKVIKKWQGVILVLTILVSFGIFNRAQADNSGANGSVNATAIQADGKIIIGGDFITYNGTNKNRIARLKADGTLDATFNSGTGVNAMIFTTVIQSDGKILIGGDFTTYNETPVNRIVRLNVDGTLDTTFNPGAGLNGRVAIIDIQTDGKILIGGDFTTYNSTNRNRIARLNTNGTLDTTFNPGAGVDASVNAIAIQPDGMVLIGGSFTSYDGVIANRIARLNTDGTVDTTFTSYSGGVVSSSIEAKVSAVTILSNGKIIIGGVFINRFGPFITASNIARLNFDGTRDTTFTGIGSDSIDHTSYVNAINVLADAKIIISGRFLSPYNGMGYNYYSSLARFNADGLVDTTFNVASNIPATSICYIYATAIQSDGKIIIGGDITTYNDTTVNNIFRLNADGTLDTSFNPDVSATGITLKTPPTKATYTAGDHLDLSGLVVTLTKSDSSTQDVAFEDFVANGISTSKSNGDTLVVGDTEIVIVANGNTTTQAITVSRMFVPYLNGYDFDNYGNSEPSWDLKKELFSEVFTLPKSPDTLNTWLEDHSSSFGTGGACFGMSLSAAKEYNGITHYLEASQFLKSVAQPATLISEDWTEIYDVSKVDTNQWLRRIVKDQLAVQKDNLPKKTIDTLFDGTSNPLDYVLVIMHGRGGHALLPHKVAPSIFGQSSYEVYVYDPNFHGVDSREVVFTKLSNGGWKREYAFNEEFPDVDSAKWNWISSSPDDTYLVPVNDFDYLSHKLSISNGFSISNASTAFLQDDAGRKTGYVNDIEYNEIPDISIFVPIEGDSIGSFSQVEFRGNLDQNLKVHIVSSSESDGVNILKWDPTSGYVKVDFQNGTSTSDLSINHDNSEVDIDSSVGAKYDIELDKVKDGQDHILNSSAVIANESNVQTYSIDWESVMNGNNHFTFGNDTDGDGTVDFSKEIDNSEFSDASPPVTTLGISGQLAGNNVYLGTATITLTASDNDGGVGVHKTEYSLDGGVNWIEYKGSFTFSGEGTHNVQYRSVDWFNNQEDAKMAEVKIAKSVAKIQTVAAPTASPAGGSYTSNQSITLSTGTGGATIHYTTDGSTPTASSATYSSSLSISNTTTLKAIAIKSGMTDSDIMTQSYNVQVITDTPNLPYSISKKAKKRIRFTFTNLSLTQKKYVTLRLSGRKVKVVGLRRSGADSIVTVELKYAKWGRGSYNLAMSYKNQIKVAYKDKKGRTKYKKGWERGSVGQDGILLIQ